MWCKIELAEHMSVIEMEKISHLAMQDTIGISTFTIDLCAVYIPPSEADYMRKNISTSPDRYMQFPGPGKSVVETTMHGQHACLYRSTGQSTCV